MQVYPSKRFTRHFKKLSPRIQERAIARDALFRVNPFHSRLETHKLHGVKQNAWAYSVDRSYRVTFVFVSPDVVVYTDIGTHDEVYR